MYPKQFSSLLSYQSILVDVGKRIDRKVLEMEGLLDTLPKRQVAFHNPEERVPELRP